MILLDWSNVVIGNIHSSVRINESVEEGLIRHMVLNSLRYYNKKFSKVYGELVICTDTYGSWRKQIFLPYKAHRAAARDASNIDWDEMYKVINKITDEVKEILPYKLIQVPSTEGDDIIAQLVLDKPREEKVMIVSADHDLLQLQAESNVKQYSPKTKEFLEVENPRMYLKEHIIRGDRGDGIPNIFEPGSFFVDKIKNNSKVRQKSIKQKDLDEWLYLKPEGFCTTEKQLERYKENEQIIDLRICPELHKHNILMAYHNYVVNDKSKILNYMIKNKLKSLIDFIQDF